ncbi:MAG TPA: hypothetical protein VF752_07385 [Thermoleophilaceae bacterium]
MADEDRKHELACLAATTAVLDGAKRLLGRKVVSSVRLEGAKPETEIVVQWRWDYEQEPHEQRFKFWSADFAESDGTPGRPDEVAAVILANVEAEQ